MAHKAKTREKGSSREALAVVIVFIGLFLTFALLSYDPGDSASALHASMGEQVISNWFGRLGAFLADPLFTFTFGYMTIVLTLFLSYLGLRMLLQRTQAANLALLARLLALAFWTSVGIAYLGYWQGNYSVYPAGFIAFFFVETSILLLGEFGSLSTSLLLLILTVMSLAGLRLGSIFGQRRHKIPSPPAPEPTSSPDGRPAKTAFRVPTEDKVVEIIRPTTRQNGEKKVAEPENSLDTDLRILDEEIARIGADRRIRHDGEAPSVATVPQPRQRWQQFTEEVRQHYHAFAEKEQPENVRKAIDHSLENTERVASEGQDAQETASQQAPHDHEMAFEIEEAVKSTDINIDKLTRKKGKDYRFPSVKLLHEQGHEEDVSQAELEMNARILEEKLADFSISAKVVKAYAGPVVTMFELKLAPGIKISKVTNLTQDLAMGMQARGIRIIAPIPGKSAVGIEIPNRKPQMVRLRSLIASNEFGRAEAKLTIALGKTVNGEVYVTDLARMPHLLIAGTTGSGKSVGINTIITSLLYRAKPDEIKFVMIDPKMLELSPYRALEQHHLAFSPDLDERVVTKPENAVAILQAVVNEMDRRYEVLSRSNVRKLEDYNKKLAEIGIDKMPHQEIQHRHLPYIIVVIDELADLMITAAKEVEQPIARLAQMARAVGIHLVVATQRPSVDVLTGVIKANFPTRLAYQVAQKNDSRTILDMMGAEQLLGNGDMLFLPPGEAKPIRLQNGFISTEEVEAVIAHIAEQDSAEPLWFSIDTNQADSGGESNFSDGERDSLFEEAKRIVVMHQQGSVSLLQRRMKVGYARAARMMDQLEEAGVVGPFEGSKAREVLIGEEDL
jgi:S-DNA-T family DNA segregation ATPase FtsK/SpoIIIE